MELEIEITRLGAQGDAVAERPDGPIFVPFTLPGERVRVAVDPKSDHATLLDVLEQSAGHAEVDEIRPVPLGSRRRASLAFGRGAKGPALGYHLSRSHELIGVEVCPVLSPRI